MPVKQVDVSWKSIIYRLYTDGNRNVVNDRLISRSRRNYLFFSPLAPTQYIRTFRQVDMTLATIIFESVPAVTRNRSIGRSNERVERMQLDATHCESDRAADIDDSPRISPLFSLTISMISQKLTFTLFCLNLSLIEVLCQTRLT